MTSTLKFMTCGSVDDGKSTLIGRLLFETGAILKDQMQALQSDSKQYGTQGNSIDYALLLDGLSAEREQGITIDVAYRFFSSSKRNFIIADSPGHEEYTRNMATAASQSDLALILINAKSGLQPQTLRHARIAAMMGISHIILAVNKMDLVHYDEQIFYKIQSGFFEKIKDLHFKRCQAIPVSALTGENLTSLSSHMKWYQGDTILTALEKAEGLCTKSQNLFFPIQWVNRANSEFRGYAGTIASGTIKVGETVFASHSKESALVKSIFLGNQKSLEAQAGEAITLSLDREIDLSRGSVLVSESREANHQFESWLFWMGQSFGYEGQNYEIHLAHQTCSATVKTLKSKINLTDLTETPCSQIEPNDIVRVEISSLKPLIFTPYETCRSSGSFILIDKISHETVAGGTIIQSKKTQHHLHYQELSVSRPQREKLNGHRAQVVWFTGLSGSGKSTLASALEIELHHRGYRTYLLDGDNIRLGLNKDLGFTEFDRSENIRRVIEVAKLMMDAGLVVLTAFITPFEKDRQLAKEILGIENFTEIFMSAPLEVCEQRDIKGLYKKARAGLIANFSGISSPYEPPKNPDMKIDSDRVCLDEAVQQVLRRFF